jgi:1-acyl-sn-glycerol-3-phosphate acyltransferase
VEPLYGLAKVLLRRPLRHGLRWRVEGVERIPPVGPVLLASNHVSYLDPLCLAYVGDLAGRNVRFLAKDELFESWWFGPIMRQLGNIAVLRGTADATGALDAAAAALRVGECLVVFPEGTISHDLEPMAGKTGAARLARAAGVPVTPVGLWGSHRVIPWRGLGHRPARRLRTAVVAVVGEPVSIGPRDNPRESTDRIMAAICAQVRRAREVYPQQPRSEADGWWVRPPETARLRSCRGRVAQQLLDASPEVPGGAGVSPEVPGGAGVSPEVEA